MQARQQQQRQNGGKNGLRLFNKRTDDEDAGAQREAMSMDYYYQSIPWIIKTWIYFLTVVVPFTLLYYCFVGIFHSTTLQQIQFLQKVAFANMLFSGLGCTFRADFWARQTLDAKGVYAKGVVSSASAAYGRTNTGNKRLPRRNRSRSVMGKPGDEGSTPTNRLASLLPRTPTLRLPRPRRRQTMPNNPGNNNNNTNTNGNTSPSTGKGLADLGKSIRLGSSSERGHTTRRHSPEPGSSSSAAPPRSHSNRASLPAVATTNSFGSSQMGDNSTASVWDVENMIPTRKQADAKPGRARLGKDMSIMEIYQVHARDEKCAMLQ